MRMFMCSLVKSFDTADRNISGPLGLFRHVYFECHARVRVWFQLAAGLGAHWYGVGAEGRGREGSFKRLNRLPVKTFRSVGQEAAPGKCVCVFF